MVSTSSSSPLSLDRPTILWADPAGVLAGRARRLAWLAAETPSLAGFLSTLGVLADAQAVAFEALRQGHSGWTCAGASGSAPRVSGFDPTGTDAGWVRVLETVLGRLDAAPAPVNEVKQALQHVATIELNALAVALLRGDSHEVPSAFAPFLAAALQVYWALHGAAAANGARQGAVDADCPVCGAMPVASVLHAGGAVQGARYLVCWLCGTEWNRPRIHCVLCGSSARVAYFGVAGRFPAVKAETCADCMSYIKVMSREQDTGVDALADDLATLQLDLMLAEQGYARIGYNPWLIAQG